MTAATGDTVVDDGGYRYHEFTTSDTFVMTQAGDVDYLVVEDGDTLNITSAPIQISDGG